MCTERWHDFNEERIKHLRDISLNLLTLWKGLAISLNKYGDILVKPNEEIEEVANKVYKDIIELSWNPEEDEAMGLK